MGANDLSTALWRQRELLELLLFKFEEQQLLLAAGRTRWLPYSTREVEAIARRLKTAGLSLMVSSADVAAELGLPSDARLRDIAAEAPGAWKEIFGSHLVALISLTNDIRAIRNGNDKLLRFALRSTQETLNLIDDSPSTYTSDGTSKQVLKRAGLVDASL
jgi:hypothetical protein